MRPTSRNDTTDTRCARSQHALHSANAIAFRVGHRLRRAKAGGAITQSRLARRRDIRQAHRPMMFRTSPQRSWRCCLEPRRNRLVVANGRTISFCPGNASDARRVVGRKADIDAVVLRIHMRPFYYHRQGRKLRTTGKVSLLSATTLSWCGLAGCIALPYPVLAPRNSRTRNPERNPHARLNSEPSSPRITDREHPMMPSSRPRFRRTDRRLGLRRIWCGEIIHRAGK